MSNKLKIQVVLETPMGEVTQLKHVLIDGKPVTVKQAQLSSHYFCIHLDHPLIDSIAGCNL